MWKKGKPFSSNHRQKLSDNHAAYKDSGAFYWSDEYKEKISKANKGHKHSEKTKELCRQAAMKRWYNEPYNPKDEHQVPIADDRPEWLKDYI